MSETRRILGGLALALAVLVFVGQASTQPATAQPVTGSATVNGPIATVALKYLGTHGGQCWTFMRNVVKEATGRTVGYDYHYGYLQAGAIEVSGAEARNGDIIQIAQPGNTGPGAFYAGLHTAIILENLGGGRFNAIDSNQNWDEMVRLRPNYNPYAVESMYGVKVRIYRIPGGGPGDAGVSNPTPPTITDWNAGDTANVDTPGSCLNLRTGPGIWNGVIDCMGHGVSVRLLSGPTNADGYTWVNVTTPWGNGWVAANYLLRVAATPPPTPTPAPAPAPTTEIVRTVDNSPGCLRFRTNAGLSSAIIDCLEAGTAVTVVNTTETVSDGYSWLNVKVGTNTGWVASMYLDP